MAEWTKATVLKTVVLRTPVNEWLGPMKEAPSNEGAFLVSATSPIGKAPGWGTGDGSGVVAGTGANSNSGPSGSSSGTWNLAWNFGI